MNDGRRRIVALLIAGFAMAAAGTAAAQEGNGKPAHPFGASQAVPDRYIVVLDPAVANPAAQAAAMVGAAGGGGQVHHVYQSALKGFAATLPAQAVQALQNNPLVLSIEQDQTVSLQATQFGATWGLDRIDQHAPGLSSTYNYSLTGAGVTAYVIDTGIRADHTEFTGRLLSGFTAIGDGRGTADCNGHGTHVAGTIGGTTYGVAKGVSLVPVRVLDCRGKGSWSGVIAGVDWVASTIARPAVGNMSLGGGKSAAVNAAVAGAVAKGVTMVVAAGNSTADACSYSPASEPRALTVGATTKTDAMANYSNYGACVDLNAPGSSITSAWYTGSSATNTISGTSMASPHVAGAAALVSQANFDGINFASPAAVGSFLVSNATAGVVTLLPAGTPNLLLYSLATGAAAEPAPTVVGIQSVTGAGVKATRAWKARASITVGSGSGNATPVANVTVSGSFVPGGSATCVTNGVGQCTVTSGSIALNIPQSTFTVNSLSGVGLVFDGNTAAKVIGAP